MRIDVITLFPELFEPFQHTSMVGRALGRGELSLRFANPRDFGVGRHRSVDDTPYGGGPGMVMRVDCLVSSLEALDVDPPGGARAHRVLLTPQGQVLQQRRLRDWTGLAALALICGHYEGVDERVRPFVDEEVSIGDYVLSGGEIAAMVVIDGCARLLAGVLGNPDSLAEESHSETGLLEYPQYTRPVDYRGVRVPEVLQSGHHQAIADWRREQARQRTSERRPDLLPSDRGSRKGRSG